MQRMLLDLKGCIVLLYIQCAWMIDGSSAVEHSSRVTPLPSEVIVNHITTQTQRAPQHKSS